MTSRWKRTVDLDVDGYADRRAENAKLIYEAMSYMDGSPEEKVHAAIWAAVMVAIRVGFGRNHLKTLILRMVSQADDDFAIREYFEKVELEVGNADEGNAGPH